MGLFRELQTRNKATFPGQGEGARLWRETFGTSKEDQHRTVRVSPQRDGGGYGASITTKASVKRLIQALASMAPGGWSDDRYRQTMSYVGIAYVAIAHANNHYRRAEFTIGTNDPNAEGGVKSVKEGEPGWDLVELLQQPNEDDSFGDLMCEWNCQLQLTGMALTWAVPSQMQEVDPKGKWGPARLYPIKTATAIPQPAVNPDYPDGYYRIQPVYPYGPFSSYPTPTSAVGAPIPAQQMIRFKYTHPLLRYDGYSPLTGLNTWIDEFNMIDQSRHASMRNGIHPTAVLKQLVDDSSSSQGLTDDAIERIIAEFEANFAGFTNVGKLLIPPPGTELEPYGNTPDQMMYESGWDQLLSAVLGGLGMTKPVVGMVEDSSYSTLYASLKQAYWVTMEPFCEMIAEKITRWLCPLYGDKLVCKIRCKPIDDHDINFTRADKLISGKAGTKNEYRKLIGLAPTQEEWGNDIAGDPSPYEKEKEKKAEQQQGAPGGMPGMPGAGGPPQPPALEEGPPQPPELGEQPGGGGEGDSEVPSLADMGLGDIEKSRPKVGKLAEGSKGPQAPQVKGLYNRVRKVLANGKYKHP